MADESESLTHRKTTKRVAQEKKKLMRFVDPDIDIAILTKGAEVSLVLSRIPTINNDYQSALHDNIIEGTRIGYSPQGMTIRMIAHAKTEDNSLEEIASRIEREMMPNIGILNETLPDSIRKLKNKESKDYTEAIYRPHNIIQLDYNGFPLTMYVSRNYTKRTNHSQEAIQHMEQGVFQHGMPDEIARNCLNDVFHFNVRANIHYDIAERLHESSPKQSLEYLEKSWQDSERVRSIASLLKRVSKKDGLHDFKPFIGHFSALKTYKLQAQIAAAYSRITGKYDVADQYIGIKQEQAKRAADTIQTLFDHYGGFSDTSEFVDTPLMKIVIPSMFMEINSQNVGRNLSLIGHYKLENKKIQDYRARTFDVHVPLQITSELQPGLLPSDEAVSWYKSHEEYQLEKLSRNQLHETRKLDPLFFHSTMILPF